MEYAVEYIEAKGHVNIAGKHPTTFEITKESTLTPRGDCIIGVSASKAAADLSEDFKQIAANDSSIVVVFLSAGEEVDVAIGRGSRKLSFKDRKSMVFRKSEHTCGRTVMIKSSKAAIDINRKLIEYMKEHTSILKILLVAIKP
ncbi:MAG: DUF371 domain-containing protein [Thermoprotei archaeon]|nr:MAG: DUF371 domain-containing protein [Thermoprotei archaeon]RLF01130.1 MAG: DUF371 domain-containing protein [Thermoprotei archaeon]